MRDFINNYINEDRGLATLALSMYRLIIFPRVIGHVEVIVIDFFEQVQNHANPSLAIIAETIKSLNICRRKSDERFMRCLPMFYVWLQSHFQCETSAFTKPYLPYSCLIKEFCESKWPGPKTKEGWIAFLQAVSDVDVVWLTPWMPHVLLLYQCGDKHLVQLPRLWGQSVMHL